MLSTILNSGLSVEDGSGRVLSFAYAFSALTPSAVHVFESCKIVTHKVHPLNNYILTMPVLQYAFLMTNAFAYCQADICSASV